MLKPSKHERELAVRMAISEASGPSGVLSRLPELVDVLGEAAAMKLLTFFGGQTIRLPRAMDFCRVLLDTGAIFSVIKNKVPVSKSASMFKISPARLLRLLALYNAEVSAIKSAERKIDQLDDRFSIKLMTHNS